MTVQHWIKTNVDLILDPDHIPKQRIFTSGGTGQLKPLDSPTRPFSVIRNVLDNPGLGPQFPTSQLRFSVWLHDVPGSMKKINNAGRALKYGLPLLAETWDENLEVFVLECRYENFSGDLHDDPWPQLVEALDENGLDAAYLHSFSSV